eukprot:1154782-Pelagomonas_calceolata.AAC.3
MSTYHYFPTCAHCTDLNSHYFLTCASLHIDLPVKNCDANRGWKNHDAFRCACEFWAGPLIPPFPCPKPDQKGYQSGYPL